VDYYKVFCELESVVQNELNFLKEFQANLKIADAVSKTPDGRRTSPSVRIPMPIPGLASSKVLVMEFVDAVPLRELAAQQSAEEGEKTKENSLKGKVKDMAMKKIGASLLTQLTEAFGRMIFGAGFIHGDPHPGNLMIQDLGLDPKLVLLDCGQYKQLSSQDRIRLAKLVSLTGQLTPELMAPNPPSHLEKQRDKLFQEIQKTAELMGLELAEGADASTAAAVALLLFGDPSVPLPAGYSSNELASNSPLRSIANFPQHLVVMGRATVMIKGIAKKLGLRWPLAEKWKEMTSLALSNPQGVVVEANNNNSAKGGEEVLLGGKIKTKKRFLKPFSAVLRGIREVILMRKLTLWIKSILTKTLTRIRMKNNDKSNKFNNNDDNSNNNAYYTSA